MPAILDVAIGTVFIFLLFSLVVSALSEVILSKFDQRAKFLHMGLQELFGETADPKNIAWRKTWLARLSGGLLSKVKLEGRTLELCQHGLINAFSRTDKPGGASPSYIPAGSFVTALLSIISRDAASSAAATTVAQSQPAAPEGAAATVNVTQKSGGLDHTAANIEVWINAIPEKKLREALQALFLVAHKDVEKFKAAVEGWFNATMDRVGGWYKRFAQKWMIVLGFALAAVLNVDTIHIVRELSVSPNLAKAVASQAESYFKSNQRPMSEAEVRAENQTKIEEAQKELSAANEGNDIAARDAAQRKVEALLLTQDADAKFHAAVNRLSTTGIPIGWDDEQRRVLGIGGKHFTLSQITTAPFQLSRWPDRVARFGTWFSDHFTVLVALFVGWFLTALAASLGAPFWFDTLSRFINLRNAGRPPGETDPTVTSTKPAPASLDKTPGMPGTTAR